MPHKLLVADERVTVQRSVALAFAGDEVQVIAAANGRQAMERIESERPDIVLAGIGLPDGDGYQVAAFIKGDSRLRGIQVVLLAGAHEPLDEARARRLGCDGVLVTPFESQALVTCVTELLSRPGQPAAPAGRVPEPGSSGREPAEAAPDPLDAYFDRLDAAFASLAAAPHREVSSDADTDFDSNAVVARIGPDPAPEVTAAEWAPRLPAGFGLARRRQSGNELALFATEHIDGDTPSAGGAASLAVSDDLIEQIARRVIARLADDSMRRLVLEAAERLVREEIERIKQTSDPGHAQSGG